MKKHIVLPLALLLSVSAHMLHSISVSAPIPVGDLMDKITILRIKTERIKDPAKLKNIHNELRQLEETYYSHVPQSEELHSMTDALLSVNEVLWETEDDIRDLEAEKEFSNNFIELARNVYLTNDKRCAIKRDINKHVGSDLTEEKSYKQY